MYNAISKKKQKLIDAFRKEKFKVGDDIYLTDKKVKSSYEYHKNDYYKILNISDDDVKIQLSGGYSSSSSKIHNIKLQDIKVKRGIYEIGKNPFNEKFNNVRPVNFSLNSIIHMFELFERRGRDYDINGIKVGELNWNPFVYINGEKSYYQRDFVWTLKQKQLLIESIYKDIQCGAVLVRKRGWEFLRKIQSEGDTELFFFDIVDGKQRLNTVSEFITDKFKDLHGNYYSDLSSYAQNKLTNNQLISYAEMPESTTDEEVLYQFLKMNYEGVPQSKAHLKYIDKLLKACS